MFCSTSRTAIKWHDREPQQLTLLVAAAGLSGVTMWELGTLLHEGAHWAAGTALSKMGWLGVPFETQCMYSLDPQIVFPCSLSRESKISEKALRNLTGVGASEASTAESTHPCGVWCSGNLYPATKSECQSDKNTFSVSVPYETQS